MWRLGFFFHEIAFGLLSVFIPLYIVTPIIGGSLVDIGIMVSLALLFSIPASFFWGYICDKTRRYKIYILLSFFSIGIILFSLAFVTNVSVFITLYIIMAVFHVAHESPKNVLIAEHYRREEWEKSYAFYEGLTEIGLLIGLLLGFLAFASSLSFGVIATYTLYLCSGLNFVAFGLSIFLIADPLMIFERRLVSMERKLDYSFRGMEASSRLMDGYSCDGKFKEERFFAFGLGLVLFSLASNLFYTPLPIFFSEPPLSLSTSMIFVVYTLSSAGSIAGFFIIGRRANYIDVKKQVKRTVLMRSLLVFILVAAIQFAFSPTILTGVVIVLMGFAWAIYYILLLSLSMALIPAGKSGLFDVLVGVGAVVGSFFGPYLVPIIGYLTLFLIAAVIFLVVFLILKILT
jgi:MFS family permease